MALARIAVDRRVCFAGKCRLDLSLRRFGNELVVPQVGWNRIHQKREHALFGGVEDHSFCYFVHSFYCQPSDEEVVVGETEYGQRYASVVARGNICGVQFHPEKSQTVGQKLLSNFARRVRFDVWDDWAPC